MFDTWAKRAIAAFAGLLAVFTIALGVSATSALAAPTFVDTSLQASGFAGFFQHQTCADPSAITAVSGPKTLTFTAAGSDVLSTPSLTDASGGNATATINGPGTVITITGTTGTTAALTADVLKFRITNTSGCVSVETVSITESSGNLSVITQLLDRVNFAFPLLATDDNVSGGIVFHATGDSPIFAFNVSNLPTGLNGSVGTGELLPGSAAPGMYNDVQVQVTDDAGAVTNAVFHLKVNGHPVAPDQTGTVVNLPNGHCLDVRNAFGTASSGELLQLWQCGAAGGIDQNFTYSRTAKELKYNAPHNGSGFCVSEVGFNQQAALAPCGSAGTQVTFAGDHYRWADGTVLDNAGFHANNGNRVLTWTFNGGANQTWSLPR